MRLKKNKIIYILSFNLIILYLFEKINRDVLNFYIYVLYVLITVPIPSRINFSCYFKQLFYFFISFNF